MYIYIYIYIIYIYIHIYIHIYTLATRALEALPDGRVALESRAKGIYIYIYIHLYIYIYIYIYMNNILVHIIYPPQAELLRGEFLRHCHTAELHLNPDPKAICQMRSPRRRVRATGGRLPSGRSPPHWLPCSAMSSNSYLPKTGPR